MDEGKGNRRSDAMDPNVLRTQRMLTPEDKIKFLIGNYVFQLAVTSSQLEEANRRIAELEARVHVPSSGNGADTAQQHHAAGNGAIGDSDGTL
jgi:hypothetical protein